MVSICFQTLLAIWCAMIGVATGQSEKAKSNTQDCVMVPPAKDHADALGVHQRRGTMYQLLT